VELLARPKLTDSPENPVGSTLELLRTVYADFADVELPEIVDFAEARKTIGNDALYLDPAELQRVDESRILRYDLTLPLLLTVRYAAKPLRIWAAGKRTASARSTRRISTPFIRRRCCASMSAAVSIRGTSRDMSSDRLIASFRVGR
jgi:hypothetical protein